MKGNVSLAVIHLTGRNIPRASDNCSVRYGTPDDTISGPSSACFEIDEAELHPPIMDVEPE